MLKWIGIVLGGIAGIILLLLAIFYVQLKIAGREVREWDARIDVLCAANGGKDVETRVYETVMAPETKEYFADMKPTRGFFVPSRSEGKTLGTQYPYVRETRVVEVLNEKDPSVVKYTVRIVRVSDNKVLGERFAYQRAGGIPGPDPGEIRNCPIATFERRLEPRVFLNHPQRYLLEKP